MFDIVYSRPTTPEVTSVSPPSQAPTISSGAVPTEHDDETALERGEGYVTSSPPPPTAPSAGGEKDSADSGVSADDESAKL